MTTSVSFIGLGRMGLPMATNLMKAGFQVIGCDVDPAKAGALAERGATIAANPGEAARRSDISISMIMNDTVLREVACGENGILSAADTGHTYVDLSTVSPAASASVRAAAAERGIVYLCGKVAGSIDLAEQAGLTL